MRSRYSAFARGKIDYLLATRDAPATEEARRQLESSAGVTWLRLEVHDTERGAPSDDVGAVEFTAHFLERATVVSMRERSRFRRERGRWLYVDGVPTVTRMRVERNAPCPCGSGRKFKTCHA